jgi:hypothetical protein
MHTKFLLGSLKGCDHLEDLHMDRRIKLKWIIRKCCGKVRTGFIQPRIGTGGRLL